MRPPNNGHVSTLPEKEVPRGRQTDVAVAVVVPVVVDVQPVLVEVADVDPVAVRGDKYCFLPSMALGIEVYASPFMTRIYPLRPESFLGAVGTGMNHCPDTSSRRKQEFRSLASLMRCRYPCPSLASPDHLEN